MDWKKIGRATMAVILAITTSPLACAAELIEARVTRLEFDSYEGITYYPFAYPPIPTRLLDETIETYTVRDIGHWANHTLGFLSHQADDPITLCVRGPSLTWKSEVWLETAELKGDQLVVEFGHSGMRVPARARGNGKKPFALVDLGTPFDAGEVEVHVRFARYEIGADAVRDARGRPVGRKLMPQEEGEVPPSAFSKNVDFTRPKPPLAVAGIDDASLQRAVDAAAEILVLERASRDGKHDLLRLGSLKGGGWYRDKQALYKTVKPNLLGRPEDEWRWIVFLPWDPTKYPPLPASGKLSVRIGDMIRQPVAWSKIGDELEIGLRAKQDHFKLGGPIDVELVTRSSGKSTQKVPTLSLNEHAHYPFLKLVVTAPDGKIHQLFQQVKKITQTDFPQTHLLVPGGSLVETVSVDLWKHRSGKGDPVFSKPGDYKLHFSVPDDRAKRLASASRSYSDN